MDEQTQKEVDRFGGGGCVRRAFVILEKRGEVPQSKGPFLTDTHLSEFVHEAVAALPDTTNIIVAQLTWNGELWVECGREFVDQYAPPIFIPLKTEWFRKFESGEKTTEYRAYGKRWNEKHCHIGRRATISHGYSGKRLDYRVTAFKKLDRKDAPEVAQAIFTKDPFIAAISLRPLAPLPLPSGDDR